MTKQYFRAKEVATYLGIGLSTVWLYAKQKKITPIKLSERITVFCVDEIDSLSKRSIDEALQSTNRPTPSNKAS